MLGEGQTDLIQGLWGELSGSHGKLVDIFYAKLFQNHEELLPLFDDVDMTVQHQKLIDTLNVAVLYSKRVEVLDKALKSLGKKHFELGVRPQHYPMVAETLLLSLEEILGGRFTYEHKQAWSSLLNQVAERMLSYGSE